MIPPNIRRLLRKQKSGKTLTDRERQALRRYYESKAAVKPMRPPGQPQGMPPIPGRGGVRRRPPLPPGYRPGRVFPGRRLFSRQVAGLMPQYCLPDDDE